MSWQPVLLDSSDKVNVSARRLHRHLGHDRQRAVGPGADDQPGSAPREFLVGRERSVSELVAVWLRGLLASFVHAPRSMTMSCSYVCPSTSIDRTRGVAHPSRAAVPVRPEVQRFGIYAYCQCAEAGAPDGGGPAGRRPVLVAKGRFQAFVDDARLFGRDWGLRLTDVKASVLADQRCDAFPARCLAQRGGGQEGGETLAIELPDGLVVRRVKGGAVTEDHRSNRGRHPGWGRWCRVRFRQAVGRRRLSDYGAETGRGRSGRGRGYQVDQARRFVEARHSQRRQPE